MAMALLGPAVEKVGIYTAREYGRHVLDTVDSTPSYRLFFPGNKNSTVT